MLKRKIGKIICCAIIASCVFTFAGCDFFNSLFNPQNNSQQTIISSYQKGDVNFHFFNLGNSNAGDCTLIQIGNTEILVDGGSKTNSLTTITNYVNNYLTDGIIEYAIITHAHEDHIACFGGSKNGESLFDKFTFGTIIDFPKTNSTSALYGRYITERDAEISAGATHYTALDCYNNSGNAKRIFNLENNATLEILYNYYYDHNTSNENNYSVCFQINYNNKHFLFTGDLEETAEEKLVENNSLSAVEFFKAGHHGSYTASTDALLNVIKPKICVVTCVAGTSEYSDVTENQFPSQEFINRISKHTTNVFVPSVVSTNTDGFTALNGTIIITANSNSTNIFCSNNSTPLKDTTWFQTNRTTPSAWQ